MVIFLFLFVFIHLFINVFIYFQFSILVFFPLNSYLNGSLKYFRNRKPVRAWRTKQKTTAGQRTGTRRNKLAPSPETAALLQERREKVVLLCGTLGTSAWVSLLSACNAFLRQKPHPKKCSKPSNSTLNTFKFKCCITLKKKNPSKSWLQHPGHFTAIKVTWDSTQEALLRALKQIFSAQWEKAVIIWRRWAGAVLWCWCLRMQIYLFGCWTRLPGKVAASPALLCWATASRSPEEERSCALGNGAKVTWCL